MTEDIVVTLNARGEFSASYHPRGDVDEATAARHEAFAAAFYGRWYSDNEDDREVRLARFERKSPVDWYIAMPLDEDSPLTAYSGNVLEGAHSPEWIGKFEMTPLWPETHQLLPPPPIEASPYNAKELAGDYYLVWTDGDDGETVLYSVSLGQDLKWASRGEEEFRGSASRREAGLAVRPSLPTRTLDDVSRLERAAAKEARADREWLLRAAAEETGPTPAPARLAGTFNVFEDDFDLFRGTPGSGRSIFLWCRRVGTGSGETVSSGVTIDSDLLFVGVLDGEGPSAEGVVAMGWTEEPHFLGRFELRRQET